MPESREKKEAGIVVFSEDMQAIRRVIITKIGGYNEIMSFSAMWDRLLEEAVTEDLKNKGLRVCAYFPSEMREFEWTTNQVPSDDFERIDSVYEAMEAVTYNRKKKKFGAVVVENG